MNEQDLRIQQPTEYWLKTQTFFLSVWGCWPRGRYHLYYAYTMCFVVIYVNHFYSSVCGISQVFGDLDKVLTFANNSSITMPASLIFLTVLTHRGKIRRLCEAVNDFYDQPEVAQHLHLLEKTRRYINDIENMIGMLMIVVFFSLTFIICLSLFQGVTRDVTFKQKYGFASACIHATLEVFIYCRLGESITSKSAQVGTTLYLTDWYDDPVDMKKAYLVIMSRSDRPLVVRAKPFYVINMATFVSVLNAAYTYFNLMREFNK